MDGSTGSDSDCGTMKPKHTKQCSNGKFKPFVEAQSVTPAMTSSQPPFSHFDSTIEDVHLVERPAQSGRPTITIDLLGTMIVDGVERRFAGTIKEVGVPGSKRHMAKMEFARRYHEQRMNSAHQNGNGQDSEFPPVFQKKQIKAVFPEDNGKSPTIIVEHCAPGAHTDVELLQTTEVSSVPPKTMKTPKKKQSTNDCPSKKPQIVENCSQGQVNMNTFDHMKNAGQPDDLGMAAYVQISSLDISLRSSLSPNQILDRPTVCCLMSSYGFIHGIGVVAGPPSYFAIALALENALTDKVDFCAQHGIEINEQEWPVQSIPSKLYFDRGDLVEGRHMESLAKGLGITISTAPPALPDLKGVVERLLHSITQKVVLWRGSESPADEPNREVIAKEGTLTLQEFEKLLVMAVVKHNHALHKWVKLTPEMVAAGVKSRPIDMWQWIVANHVGLPLKISVDRARFYLLPSDDAVMTSRGIAYRGLHYTCERAVREGWFENARLKGRLRVSISYDPSQVDRIYLHHPDGQSTEPCVLMPSDRRFQGCTWAELVRFWKQVMSSQRAEANCQKGEN